jgi:hypothetical protein
VRSEQRQAISGRWCWHRDLRSGHWSSSTRAVGATLDVSSVEDYNWETGSISALPQRRELDAGVGGDAGSSRICPSGPFGATNSLW